MNGLNRLPRPMLALGTLGLFVYAMAEPAGFAERMQGLQLVPEPLWWLLGAIVSFYFGARELHHFRTRQGLPLPTLTPAPAPAAAEGAAATPRSAARPAPVATAPRPAPRPQPTAPAAAVEPQPANRVSAPPAASVTRAEPVASPAARAADPTYNAAIEEWRQGQGTSEAV